jgi:hypothetical protein
MKSQQPPRERRLLSTMEVMKRIHSLFPCAALMAALTLAACSNPPAQPQTDHSADANTPAGKLGKAAHDVAKETHKAATEAGRELKKAAKEARAGWKEADREDKEKKDK